MEAIPSGQWESARSLGYRRLQILRHVVVPQSIPLMLPNLMNLYAALFIGTSLIVVSGTTDILAMSRTVIATDGERVATAVYLYVLALFFLFAFPIAVASRLLEVRFRVTSMSGTVTPPLIAFDRVHKAFGGIEVLKGVSLEVYERQVACIIGPSGSGKSTLLRCINGLVPIDQGSIRVGPFEVETLYTERALVPLRHQVSIVFQQVQPVSS